MTGQLFIHGIILLVVLVTTSQALMVRFSESDYAATEGNPLRVTVQALDFSTGDADLTVRVSPLTKAQFLQLPEANRSQCVLSFAPETDFAEESDFNVSAQDITFTSNGDEVIFIPLTQDIIQENDEILVLFLEVIGNYPGLNIGRVCTTARIRTDSDSVSVAVTGTSDITVDEDAGILNNLFTVTKVGETELEITVLVQLQALGVFNAENGSDFFLRDAQFVLQPSDTEVAIPIEIIDDNIPEDTEAVQFRISIVDNAASAVTANMRITDNDAVTVGFLNDTSLTVEEGGEMRLCVGVITPTDVVVSRLIDLRMESMDDTALEGVHYTKVGFLIELIDVIRVGCRTVQIMDDDLREPPRTFTVTLIDDSEEITPLTTIQPNTITITITDNDSLTPNAPTITELDADADKRLLIKWLPDITDSRPVDSFRIIITEVNIKDDGDVTRETTREVDGDVTSYLYSEIDPDTIYTVRVCATNNVGENCSTPVTYKAPTAAPTPITSPPPGIIAVIVVVVVFFVLLCCLCWLILCICFFKERDNEKNYYPEKNEKKYREQYDEYRGESDEDSESGDIV